MDYRERFEIKDYRNERMLGGRIGLMHAAVIVLLVSFALNFWYLQVVRGDQYAALAENNRLRKVVLRPTRGMIRDREGRVVASTRPSINLVLTRESVSGPRANEEGPYKRYNMEPLRTVIGSDPRLIEMLKAGKVSL